MLKTVLSSLWNCLVMDLVYFNKARLALEKATEIDEVKDIRDKAEALRFVCEAIRRRAGNA